MASTERTQSMDWFGEPWPAADRRADVCANDEYRQPIPVGTECSSCNIKFDEFSQGILIPMLLRDGWTAWHISCFIDSIKPPAP